MRHRCKNPVGCGGTAQTKKWVVCVLFETKKRTTRERASYTPAEYCSWTRRVVDGEQAGESRTRADRSSAVACSPIAIYYRSLTFSFCLLCSQDCRINGDRVRRVRLPIWLTIFRYRVIYAILLWAKVFQSAGSCHLCRRSPRFRIKKICLRTLFHRFFNSRTIRKSVIIDFVPRRTFRFYKSVQLKLVFGKNYWKLHLQITKP